MIRFLLPAVLLALAPACLSASEGGSDCTNERDDDGDHLTDCEDPGCALLPACGLCGNGALDPSEGCDDGNSIDGDGCSTLCRKEGCGNGEKEKGEECDDGNLIPADGCSALCEVDRCADRILELSLEECEDGNRDDGDGCDHRCQLEELPFCGDFQILFDPETFAALEQCDDGNRRSGDGCSGLCTSEFCGDGVIQPTLTEQCDDADPLAPPECVGCRIPRCGDGFFSPNEQCDDGNTRSNDGCSETCRAEFCGDGIVQPALNEACDDGNNIQNDSCVGCQPNG